MTVLEIVKSKTKNLPELADVDIQLAIDEIEQHIKNFINYDTDESIPDGHLYTWANMSRDLVKYDYYANQTLETLTSLPDIDPNLINTLKVGDVSISLGSGTASNDKVKALRSHNATLDDITMNYKNELYRFRRMVW
jgi:hypothetical protein